ncbi:MAG: c-type cytochrome [Limnohabitans sp.]|jgi:cytochrome c551/c552
MSSFRKALLTTALVAMAGLAMAQSDKYPGLGRAATPKEVAKWDIDVRPDFKGLPPGSGSVAKGQDVWEAKCAHCHGIFGESNEVFSALIGGTTAEDIKTGRVANLSRTDFPGRTTIMKVATVSTLWDYINRAMPWTSPKTLTTEEVYSVTAFLLSLANVVPDDFVLSDKNIADVQKRMPNRNGMTTAHAMWPGKEFNGTAKPDTANTVCMKDCAPEPKHASLLPDFARNAHGNLAEQNRLVGQQKGADTTRPEGKGAPAPGAATPAASAAPKADAGSESKAVLALLNKHSCTACHGVDKKVVGPGFNEIAKKHAGKADYLAAKIKSGGSGVWGPVPMPPQSLPDADAKAIAAWIAKGATK